MKINFWAIVIAMVAVMVSSCNNDIFVDRNFNLPEETEITIAGDGGYDELAYQPRGLSRISVGRIISSGAMFSYYDRKGVEIPQDSKPGDIGSIVYNDPFCEFSIGFSGNRITFSCLQNCTEEKLVVKLRLEYDYAVKSIVVNVEPGEPMFMFDWKYDSDYTVDYDFRTITDSRLYNNNSSNPIVVYVAPYRSATAISRVVACDVWADGKIVDMPLPTFNTFDDDDTDSEWIYMSRGEYKIGSDIRYEINDAVQTVPVEIPANSSVRITVDVACLKAEFHGEMKFIAPVYSSEYSTRFIYQMVEPWKYTIKVEPK